MIHTPNFLTPRSFGRRVFASASYTAKVLGIEAANLLAYFPMDEVSGTAMVNAAPSGSGHDGTYNSITLANAAAPGASMGDAPYFNGTSAYAALVTTTTQAAVAAGEFSFSVWVKMDTGVLTDGVDRMVLSLLVDANNWLTINKSSAGNALWNNYIAGGAGTFGALALTSYAWVHVGVTVSLTNDRVIYYLAGTGASPVTGVGTWSGTLTYATLGSYNPYFYYTKGWLTGAGFWSKELTAAQMADLAVAV